MGYMIANCAKCHKHRVVYVTLGVEYKKTIYTLNSKEPCCQRCFEKEVKRQLKAGVLDVR